jgi:hypothetical protein
MLQNLDGDYKWPVRTTRQIFTYFALPNGEKSLPPTCAVIEDSYCKSTFLLFLTEHISLPGLPYFPIGYTPISHKFLNKWERNKRNADLQGLDQLKIWHKFWLQLNWAHTRLQRLPLKIGTVFQLVPNPLKPIINKNMKNHEKSNSLDENNSYIFGEMWPNTRPGQ